MRSVGRVRGSAKIPSQPSPLTTGNGFGFAVYRQDQKGITELFAHPYRFMRLNAKDPHADGPQTPNLVERIAWMTDGAVQTPSEVDYRAESNIIRVHDRAKDQVFYMPFGLDHNVLVTSAEPTEGAHAPRLKIDWAKKTKSERTEQIAGRDVRIIRFDDREDTVGLVPLDLHAMSRANQKTLSGSTAWAIITVETPEALEKAVEDVVAWQNAVDPAALAAREAKAQDAWRVPPPAGLSKKEAALFRQSETILRMAQIREPATADRHAEGLILASLPDGEWFIPWVRDMSYATVALARMGHRDEARRAVDALLDARPIGANQDLVRGDAYQISTDRYTGDGAEQADTSGEKRPNLELDSWGLALWAIGEYVEKYDDTAWLRSKTYRGTAYENMRDFVVKPLLDNLDPHRGGLIVAKDTSIWEQNDAPPMHYAASTICAINGLRWFRKMAARAQDAETIAKVDEKLRGLQEGFESAFVRTSRGNGGASPPARDGRGPEPVRTSRGNGGASPPARDGRGPEPVRTSLIHGVLEDSPRNDVDGAALLALDFGVETDPEVIRGTLAGMSALAEPSGGWRRVTGDTSYEKHEFLFIDFLLARALLRLGRADDATKIVDRLVERAVADHGNIPEMEVSVLGDDQFPGQIGDPTGAIPMVGYGAGIYALFLLERAAIAEANGRPPAEA